jgi:8-oxo-dGTP pyrophosphatase MutT (NUDIX family)
MPPDHSAPERRDYSLTAALRDRLRAHLAAFEPRSLRPAGLRRAAVGVVVAGDDAGRACFVLTRRTTSLRRHAGQWALPGGRLDDGETPEVAVLREIHEELGLALDAAAIVGRLDEFATRSSHLITPLVLWGGAGVALRPNPVEVEAAYRVPIAELDRPGNPGHSFIPESDRPLIHFALLETTVYAPTAAILYQFREVAVHGRAVRVAHFEQPRFAWQ